ncbi:MAG: HDOD domain-containing protein [Nitrospirae bacterium]|jgi:putative nucleotidyltransferase with HDIG domain|nr:HDOD domain-containing protein [Nitrospirota bacterium]
MDENRIISSINELPVLPEVVLHINELLKKSASSIDEVADLIEKDSALSSKVLRLANSSYYGLSSQVDSVSRAIIVLGFNNVCNVVTSIGVSAIFKENYKGIGIDLSGLWIHTLGCAVASKVLMSLKNDSESEKAFICGILHDIGKIIIAKTLPSEQKKVFDALKKSNKTISELENEIIGTDHAKVGFAIAKKWRFPDYILDVIRFHHIPHLSKEASDITVSVHLGNAIAKALSLGISTDPKVAIIAPDLWKQIGIDEKKIHSVISAIQNEFDLAMEFWMEI